MKKLLVLFVPILMILFLGSVASAGIYGTYDSYPDPMQADLVSDLAFWAEDDEGGAVASFDGVLVGSYYVTLIGWEAGYDNVFGSVEDGTLLAKFDYSMIGDWTTVVNFSTDGAYFQSPKGETSPFNTDDIDIEMWLVTGGFGITYPGDFDLMLRAGDIVAGYDDNPDADDDNHDDLIVAFRAVPIPAPVLLLGLGLLSVVGVRRRIFK